MPIPGENFFSILKHKAVGFPYETFDPVMQLEPAYENKAMLTKIMEQANMKSTQTAHRYIRHTERCENHAGENLL